MKEKMLERFKFKAELKEQLVHMVMDLGVSVKNLAKKYLLPYAATPNNWIAIYKKRLEKGAVSLPSMKTTKKETFKAFQQKNKDWRYTCRKIVQVP